MTAFLPQVNDFAVDVDPGTCTVIVECLNCNWQDVHSYATQRVELGLMTFNAVTHYDEKHR